MKITPVDPDAFRADMLRIMASMREDALRWRFEIEAEGRHIGLVSSCYLDENDRSIPWEAIDQENAEETHALRALGIEICEREAWGKGLGAKALTAFMEYYRAMAERRFLPETWSGNARMLGFAEVRRTRGFYLVNGEEYDAPVPEKRFD